MLSSAPPLHNVTRQLHHLSSTVLLISSDATVAPLIGSGGGGGGSVSSNRLGFTAYETSTLTSYLSGERIDFPDTVVNLGNHYDTFTGIFRCPFDGFYLFSASVMSNGEDEFVAEIMKGGVLLVSAYADGLPADVSVTRHQATQVALTECSVGEQVWLEAGVSGTLYSGTQRYATFTGVILSQYDTDGSGEVAMSIQEELF